MRMHRPSMRLIFIMMTLKTADDIMTFKLAVKTIAKRHGLYASFMPKPKTGVNGSGMHINMSLARDGVNVFYDGQDCNHLSKEGYWFIGGIMKHIAAITAIANPLVNSYKRLVPGYEAPVYIAWSMRNRSPLSQIRHRPVRHSELNCAAGFCDESVSGDRSLPQPAGLDGIRNQIEPPASVEGNIFYDR